MREEAFHSYRYGGVVEPMASDVELVVLGWVLGIVSALLAPMAIEYLKEQRDLKKFKKNLLLEIERMNQQLEGEKNVLDSYYGINSEEDLKVKLPKIAQILQNPGKDVSHPIYDQNLEKLSSLEDSLTKELQRFIARVDSLNHCKKVLTRSDLSSAVKESNTFILYRHLVNAIKESKALIERLTQK